MVTGIVRGWSATALAERLSLDSQLDPADAEAVAVREVGAHDLLVVDERAVGARQVLDLDVPIGGRQPAVNPRDERCVQDEVGSGRAADGLDRARRQAECPLGTLKNPHVGAILTTRDGIQSNSY